MKKIKLTEEEEISLIEEKIKLFEERYCGLVSAYEKPDTDIVPFLTQPQVVLLPKNGSETKIRGLNLTSYYVAGYAHFGFNYTNAYYLDKDNTGFNNNYLVMTPNHFGTNLAMAGIIVKTEQTQNNDIMHAIPALETLQHLLFARLAVSIRNFEEPVKIIFYEGGQWNSNTLSSIS